MCLYKTTVNESELPTGPVECWKVLVRQTTEDFNALFPSVMLGPELRVGVSLAITTTERLTADSGFSYLAGFHAFTNEADARLYLNTEYNYCSLSCTPVLARCRLERITAIGVQEIQTGIGYWPQVPCIVGQTITVLEVL